MKRLLVYIFLLNVIISSGFSQKHWSIIMLKQNRVEADSLAFEDDSVFQLIVFNSDQQVTIPIDSIKEIIRYTELHYFPVVVGIAAGLMGGFVLHQDAESKSNNQPYQFHVMSPGTETALSMVLGGVIGGGVGLIVSSG